MTLHLAYLSCHCGQRMVLASELATLESWERMGALICPERPLTCPDCLALPTQLHEVTVVDAMYLTDLERELSRQATLAELRQMRATSHEPSRTARAGSRT